MDVASRVAAGFVEAERRRALAAPHGEVVELDGVVMAFTNLPDESLNAGLVTGQPADPAGAIAAAEASASERGQPLGLEVEAGRFPEVEDALTAAGLTRLFSHAAMTVDPDSMWHAAAPQDLHVTAVVDAAGLSAMVHVETEAFGTDPEVARGLFSMGMVRDPETRAFVGMLDGSPVAQSIATHHERAVGVFGVGVRSPVRRRGIGAAMTWIAASAFPDANLVWLHPTIGARSMYERLGFRVVAQWDVWTRPTPSRLRP
jgi:ribosomal protein S18 acetylase RimI-like enzyme